MKVIILILLIFSIVGCTTIINLNQTQWYFKEHTHNITPYSSQFMKANIPSTVHLDLIDNNVVPDPYFRDNLLKFYSLEEKDWIYKTIFDGRQILNEQKRNNSTEIQLVFEGLDTYADVYINHHLVLSAHNMFRTWIIHHVEQYLENHNHNNIEIIFKSSVKHDLLKEKESDIHLPFNYTYTRKAAYQYGWDWGPRLVTCGIWKDSYFKFVKSAEILNTHIRTLEIKNANIGSGKGDAVMKIDVELSSYIQESDYPVILTIKRDHHLIYEKQHLISSGNSTISTFDAIKDAHLWWCQGMGQPNLYHYSVILRSVKSHQFEKDNQNINDDDNNLNNFEKHRHNKQKGEILSQKQYRTGIRQIKVDQRNDKSGNGTSFSFILNGYYLFAKGANYIPPDMFMPRALKNPQVYHKTIQDAVNANHNMIRLWGGGQFEYDIFYDLCDENGLLIWHDLMFACAMYPADKDILFNIEQELLDNVKRLRNHPSIGLWNGNNEVKIGWDSWGWQDSMTEAQREIAWGWYLDIFNVTLRNVFEQQDPDVYYWPTSPSSEVNFVYQVNTGDIHFWNVWASGAPIEEYDEFVGRLNSEYGMQGILSFESIKKFTYPEDRQQVNTTVMEIHERHVRGYPLISQYLQQYFIEPTDFKDYIYISQVMQAYAIQTAILALRRNKPYCSGSLYWQLNDVWPVVSWASVDFYGNWKALHFRQKHLYQNVIVAVERNGTNFNEVYTNSQSNIFNVRIINDLHKRIKGSRLIVKLLDNTGYEIRSYLDEEVRIHKDSNDIYLQLDLSEYSQIFNKIALHVKLITLHNSWEYVHYFVIPQQFQFIIGNINAKQINHHTLEIMSDYLIRDFYIYCGGDDDDYREIQQISNNYFDLLPYNKYILHFPKNNACSTYAYKTLNHVMLNHTSYNVLSFNDGNNNYKQFEIKEN